MQIHTVDVDNNVLIRDDLVGADCLLQYLHHLDGALDLLRYQRFRLSGGFDTGIKIANSGQHHTSFTQAWQHPGNVIQEGSVRSDDEDAGLCQLIAVGVQQPSHSMQGNCRFTRAWTTLDHHGAACGVANNHILLALNRLHDAMHKASTRLIEYLAQHGLAAHAFGRDDGVLVQVGVFQPLIVEVPHRAPASAQVPTQVHALGVRGGCEVEGAGTVGTPVHDDGAVIVLCIGEPDASDIASVDLCAGTGFGNGVVGLLIIDVDAPEYEADFGGAIAVQIALKSVVLNLAGDAGLRLGIVVKHDCAEVVLVTLP